MRRLRCPVLAMHGDQDEYGSRAHPDRIAALVPGLVEVAIIENCRHVPPRDKPDEVLRLMSDFIRDLSIPVLGRKRT